MYSGGIMAAILVGSLLLSKFGAGKKPLAKSSLFFGLLVMTLLCAIPYLGFLFFLVAMLSGAGAIVLGVRSCRAEAMNQSMQSDLPPPVPPVSGNLSDN